MDFTRAFQINVDSKIAECDSSIDNYVLLFLQRAPGVKTKKEGSREGTLTKNINNWASLHPVGCRAARETAFVLFMATLKPTSLLSCVAVVRAMLDGGPGLSR